MELEYREGETIFRGPRKHRQMAYKYRDEKPIRPEKLSKEKRGDLLYDFVNAFSLLKSPTEAALLVQDLLTEKEVTSLSKRLRIAKLLLDGKKYDDVAKEVHTSHVTVSKISAWLNQKGDGFRLIVKRLPEKITTKSWRDYSDWDKFKRGHPLYFWPELVFEELVKSANKKEKEKLKKIIESLEKKSSLHKKLQELFAAEYKP